MWLRLATVLICVAGISGCAIIDTTMQETAMPRDTTGVEIVAYCGSGVPIYSKPYYNNDKDDGDFWLGLVTIVIIGSALSSTVDGVKVNIPVSPQTDFVGQLYTTGYGSSWGGRLGVKQLIKKDLSKSDGNKPGHNTYWAILPTIHYNYQNNYGEEGESTRMLAGIGCLFLFSWFRDKTVISTMGLRGSYDYLELKNYDDEPLTKDHLYHCGLNLNLKISGKIMSVTPEIGIEVYPGMDKPIYLAPFINMGIGWH